MSSKITSVRYVSSYKVEMIKEIIRMKCLDPKTKITDDAVCTLRELLKLATVEAVIRAGVQASREGCDCVCIDHVEKILPQMILDL